MTSGQRDADGRIKIGAASPTNACGLRRHATSGDQTLRYGRVLSSLSAPRQDIAALAVFGAGEISE